MKLRSLAFAACLGTSTGSMVPLAAEPLRETVVSSQQQPIPNITGKTLVAMVVDYQPGGASPSHRHPGADLIYAHVLSGAIRGQLNDEEPKVYRTGESWFELPGAHHKLSENASATEPARLLVIFVVDTASRPLIAPDRKS
jgi:quercetin dioxygenase-like cupin family protein